MELGGEFRRGDDIGMPEGPIDAIGCGDDAPGRVENIRASGSPQLLADITSVKGLEELSSLIEPLTAAGAKVQVLSPPRIVITLPADAKKQEQLKRDIG